MAHQIHLCIHFVLLGLLLILLDVVVLLVGLAVHVIVHWYVVRLLRCLLATVLAQREPIEGLVRLVVQRGKLMLVLLATSQVVVAAHCRVARSGGNTRHA